MMPMRFLMLVVATTVSGCAKSEIDTQSAQHNPAKPPQPAAEQLRARAAGTTNQRQVQQPRPEAPSSPVSFQSTVATPSESTTDDWRQFRGPNASGVSNEIGLPTKWSATENIHWKRRLPGAGASSPIVVGNRVFVTCYSGYGLSKNTPGDPANLKRHLVCLDRKTGRILWNTTVTHERKDHGYSGFMQLHGYASSSPVSDGRNIYAYFGNWGAYAFDRDGKKLWRFDCGSRVHGFGSGASPILHGRLLIVNASVEGEALIAIDTTTGKQVWRSERITDSWSTPLIVAAGGRTEIVLPTRQGIKSFDAKTGGTLWNWVGAKGTTYTCPSLVQHKGTLYGLASYNGPFAAIRPGGNGDVSKTHAAWTSTTFRTTVVSPVHHAGHVYNPHDDGGYFACIDAATGVEKQRVRPRPGWGKLYASPLVADGKIYVVTRSRGTYVFKATPTMEQIAVNTIAGDDSVFNGSPVAHNGQLLIRSDTYLYCIGR